MKKYRWFTFILILLFSQHVFSQEYFVIIDDGIGCGYVNTKGDKINAKPLGVCTKFSDHRAVVAEYNSMIWYLLTEKGEKIPLEVSKFKFESTFSNGMLAIEKDKKYGYLDTTGKLVIPVKYDEVTSFDQGYAVAKLDKKYFIITKTGKEIPITNPEITRIKSFSEGLAPFISGTNHQLGFIDSTGNIVIPGKFKSVGSFIGGLAWAKTLDDKVGFIDPKGNWAIPPKFEYAKSFDLESGMARIKINDQWAYTNTKGEVLYVTTSHYGDFNNGLALGALNGKSGYFDQTGNWVIKPQFENANSFHNGYAMANSRGFWGIIDTQGKWVLPPTFIIFNF